MTEENAIIIWLNYTGASEYPKDLIKDRGTYWYLPNPTPVMGSAGTIISKTDSKITPLGSSCPPPDAFWAYEHGFLNERCDLVITSISDMENMIDCLTKTPPSQRVSPRPMSRDGWYDRLSNLPVVVLEGTPLHNYIHELKEISDNGYGEFTVVSVDGEQ